MENDLNTLIIGSRGSKLALWQSNFVRDTLIELNPGLDVQIKIISTKGDEIQNIPLPAIGDKGLFTEELNRAILSEEIHCAVHSLKDLPTDSPKGISLAAVLNRNWRSDALVSPKGLSIDKLPQNAEIATGSLRRKSLLQNYRPDFRFVEIRGNVDTRLRKVRELGHDGLILAEAGLRRLGLEDAITQIIPAEILLPAPAQGALGITIADKNPQLAGYFRDLDDSHARTETTAERMFLEVLEGGCHVPIGASAYLEGDTLRLDGALGNLDGSRVLRDSITDTPDTPEALGKSLALRVLEMGGRDILDEVNSSTPNIQEHEPDK